jgi:hypothetical protein
MIGKDAVAEMLNGIRDVREMVLDGTVHMLRFTHPVTYANAIRVFLLDEFNGKLFGICT